MIEISNRSTYVVRVLLGCEYTQHISSFVSVVIATAAATVRSGHSWQFMDFIFILAATRSHLFWRTYCVSCFLFDSAVVALSLLSMSFGRCRFMRPEGSACYVAMVWRTEFSTLHSFLATSVTDVRWKKLNNQFQLFRSFFFRTTTIISCSSRSWHIHISRKQNKNCRFPCVQSSYASDLSSTDN